MNYFNLLGAEDELKEVLTDNKLRAQLKDLERVDAKDYPSIAFCQKLSALEKSTDIVKHQCFIEILYQYPAKELALLLLNFIRSYALTTPENFGFKCSFP